MSDQGSRKALGRGLAALFGDETPEGAAPVGPASASAEGVRELPIERILPNDRQPRRRFDEDKLEELAASMRTSGILQPILVRPHPGRPEAFEIVAGERRWRAAQKARLHQVPAIVRPLSDRETLEVALIENVQRQDLSPLEEAGAYKRLIEEFGYSQEQLGRELGRSRSHVANTLRLLNLPDAVRLRLESGELSAGHARTLLSAPDPVVATELVIARGLSVRQTEGLVQRLNEKRDGEAAGESETDTAPRRGARKGGRPEAEGQAASNKDADTRALEQSLEAQLGLQVDIGFDGRGGTLTLRYKTLEQLDDLVRRLANG